MMFKLNLKKFLTPSSKKCAKSVFHTEVLWWYKAKFGTPQKSVILRKNLPYNNFNNDKKFQLRKCLDPFEFFPFFVIQIDSI